MNEVLETEKYIVVKSVLSEEILELAKNYYTIKFLIQKDFEYGLGNYVSDVPDIVQPFSVRDYSDAFTESLLIQMLPKVRKIADIETLEPTYSYVRFYETGQWLAEHTDRPSCQYSITLPMMAYDETPWTIYVDKKPVDLSLGDMVIYKGCEARHSREPFEGKYQVQAHLHYVDGAHPAFEHYVNDGRPSLGMKKEQLNA
ncbi:MAG: hypothetical protein VW270_15905 [Candidatus Poseidoniales archaeon]